MARTSRPAGTATKAHQPGLSNGFSPLTSGWESNGWPPPPGDKALKQNCVEVEAARLQIRVQIQFREKQ
ncbi:MAG: hypothetical protein ACJA0Y_001863 [Maricaulis maris]|jgi:hypothetical protein